MTFKPTPEQEAVLQYANTKDSLIIDALAGCAKTSTIELLASQMTSHKAIALAFNVKIKKELESRLPKWFKVSTLNGVGHVAWGRTINKRCEVDEKKLTSLLKELIKEDQAQLDPEDFIDILALTRQARHNGLTHEEFHNASPLLKDEFSNWEDLADVSLIELKEQTYVIARELLRRSTLLSYQGVIDYDDQIYMSAVFGGSFEKYNTTIIDEAQDLSPLNHRQLRKLSIGRIIAVGDPRQAIYAFRGASSDSMERVRALRENFITLPLSTTFRCPKSVVSRQQEHAPGYTAAESNAVGEVNDWRHNRWDLSMLPKGEVAFICRNNGPIIKLAFMCIRRGRGVTVLGRDLGKGLIKLLNKLCPTRKPIEEALAIFKEWEVTEVSKARASGKEEKVSPIQDRAECLISAAEASGAKDSVELARHIEDLFNEQAGKIVLCTGHKSKGLEWHTVIHLDPWRVPAKYARRALEEGNPVPMQQEKNLRYVIETRTKHTLILASMQDFEKEEEDKVFSPKEETVFPVGGENVS